MHSPPEFEWDEEKREENLRKHGIDFLDAVRIFRGWVLEQSDERRDYGERRLIAVGATGGLEITVVYTWRRGRRRLISARRSRSDERQAYRAALETNAAD